MNSRALLVNILVIIIIVAGGGAAFYYYNQSANRVTTNNARVDGQSVTISATAAGKLTNWSGEVGKTFSENQRVGSIAAGQNSVDVTIPISATIVQQSAVPNSFVSPGTPLARAFDLDNLWITANIDENDINDVKPGQTVDVVIDAFPNTQLTGTVERIGLATASTFSLLPASNSNANYTKVAQVIPITITIGGYKGLGLVPGMSASVKINL